GTKSQPIELDDTQRASPRRALTESQSWESQSRDTQPEEAIVAPAASKAATVATAEASDSDDEGLDERFVDDFDRIEWARLPQFCKPLRTLKHKKSWIFRHGYRLALISNPARTFFICKYCHKHRILDLIGEGKYDVTKSTAAA
ncbi:hypothetical protein K469DRAFT_481119, partial [Zopfia rhizophila CBS 207.26]